MSVGDPVAGTPFLGIGNIRPSDDGVGDRLVRAPAAMEPARDALDLITEPPTRWRRPT